MNKKPVLILISGVPSSGKTTLAKKLSSHFKVPFFSADEIKETISERITGKENKKLYDRVLKASYCVFYKNIEKILSIGGTCIAEALFLREFAESEIKSIQKKFNPKIIQIYLKADEKVLTARYDKRHLSGKRHKSHVPKMSILLKKYGGYENLLKKAKLKISKTIEINTDDFKKIKYEKIFNKLEDML